MASQTPTKLTAMHYKHLALGATMLDDNGWQRPAYYSSVQEETDTIKRTGGICDISPNGKIMLHGVDLDRFIEGALSYVGTLMTGRAARCSAQLTKTLPDNPALLCRLSKDEAFVTTMPDTVDSTVDYLMKHIDRCSHLINVSSGLAGVKIIGPLARSLMSRLTELPLTSNDFPDLSCAQSRLAELYALIVRSDEKEQPSYEVYVERSYGEFIWEATLNAGDELGLEPVGIEALQQLKSVVE